MPPASLCNPRLTHWCCHRGSVGGHTTCCWTPPYSFYIFKVAVSLCKVHSRPVKRFSGSASLTCEENSGRDRNVQMHFTLFQVLAGITRLPHCCVTLALPLCLPIMSYYKLQRPEFNKDNLTPTYNTILNTDGTVRSPKGKGMRAAADSDVIQRHIMLGAEFLQLKKGQIHRKLHNYYNKNRKRFRCFHIRADVRWAHLHHSPVMSSIRLAFKSSTFSVNDFFFLL